MTYRTVLHVESGHTLVSRARWCDDFTSKLRGFTFKRNLAVEDGLVLVEASDSRLNTAIHMLFVFFDLGIIWVNDDEEVVDARIARAWRSFYAPRSPARYVVELHPDIVGRVRLGDHIRFLKVER